MGQTTRGGAAAKTLAHLERSLTSAVRYANLPRVRARLAEEAGLSLPAYSLLTRLGDEGPCRMSDLAGGLGIDLSAVSRQVKHLEQARWLRREADPHDGRATTVGLTADGRRVAERLRVARCAAIDDLLADWDDDDRAELARLLDRLTASFETLGEQ